jgi:hypothetical protein
MSHWLDGWTDSAPLAFTLTRTVSQVRRSLTKTSRTSFRSRLVPSSLTPSLSKQTRFPSALTAGASEALSEGPLPPPQSEPWLGDDWTPLTRSVDPRSKSWQ